MSRLNKRGLYNMILGTGIGFAGTFIYLFSVSLTGYYFELSLLAVFLGPLLFLVGLVQTTSYGLKGKKGRTVYHNKIGKRLIIKAMIAVAAADGKLESNEIQAIQAVSEAIHGKPKSKARIIWEVRVVFEADDYDIIDMFEKTIDFIEPEFPELIIKAMLFVARSDGKIDPQETGMLIRLAKFLGVSGANLKKWQNTDIIELDIFNALNVA